MAYDTALTIISDASTELGLGAVSDAFGSADDNVIQLCALLKSCGRKVRRLRSWKQLQRYYVFKTTADQGRYALPTDYGRFLPDTAWNRTNRLPLGGPIGPADYQALKSRLVGVVFNILFRELNGNFQAFPDNTTQGGWVIAYEYTSKFWVTPSGTTAATTGIWNDVTVYSAADTAEHGGLIYSTAGGGTSGTYGPIGTSGTITDGGVSDWSYVGAAGADDVTANADVVNFDSHLMSRCLKLAWLEASGMDTAAAAQDYNQALAAAFDDDSQGKTLFVTGNSMREPLISAWNFPDTGYGS